MPINGFHPLCIGEAKSTVNLIPTDAAAWICADRYKQIHRGGILEVSSDGRGSCHGMEKLSSTAYYYYLVSWMLIKAQRYYS